MQFARNDTISVGWEDVPLDLDTPVSVYLKLQSQAPSFLLESVEKGEQAGRFSFIGLGDGASIIIQDGKIINQSNSTPITRTNFKELLDRQLDSTTGSGPFADNMFWGGWVGYIGYDLVQFMEDIRLRDKPSSGFPEAVLFRTSQLVVFDHVNHTGRLIVSGANADKSEIAAGIRGLEKALRQPIPPWADHMLKEWAGAPGRAETSAIPVRPQAVTAPGSAQGKPADDLTANMSREDFISKTRKILNYIREGDIFQAVPSIRFTGTTGAPPFEIYRALRILNPSPYMFYFDFGDFQLIGSSPESHAQLVQDRIAIRPIAGTRRRGVSRAEDQALEKELAENEKERAEHVMLIDLARNDLGKLCVPGSIRLSEEMVVERYSHVMHLVSQVEGVVLPEVKFSDILQATFPAGTVSGAPKLRAMEIIDELEPEHRGPYAGAVGYFGFNGNMDLCIGIRMIAYRAGQYFLQAGAGIVSDSVPESEYEEVRQKMEGMHQAVRRATATTQADAVASTKPAGAGLTNTVSTPPPALDREVPYCGRPGRA